MEGQLAFLFVLSVPVVVASALTWMYARVRMRRVEKAMEELRVQGNADLVSMLHSLTAQVDRIEEAQRFMAEALTTKESPRALEGRQATARLREPHP